MGLNLLYPLDDGHKLKNADSYTDNLVTEVTKYVSDHGDDMVTVVEEDLPLSPALSDPWCSLSSEALWSDDDSKNLGPLPFSERIPHIEVILPLRKEYWMILRLMAKPWVV